MRRVSTLLVLLAALVMVAAFAPPTSAAPVTPIGTFLDDDGNIFEGWIEAIADVGVTRGCNPPANDAYCPMLPVTRAQAASFLVRALRSSGAPLPAPVETFTDDDGSVHEIDIEILAALGITKGCNPPDNNRFCPDDPITREQMAAFLSRAFGYVDTDPGNRFVDDDMSIFESQIEALAGAGVTKGCNPPTNDRFCPSGLVLRDQMAAFLGRALGLTQMVPPDVDSAEFVTLFFLVDETGGPFLTPVARYVPAGTATAETALERLLAGPMPGELVQIPAFSTEIPSGTALLGVTTAGGVATVDLTGEFDDGGGSATMFARLGQVAFTMLARPGIESVEIALDGAPVTVFSSEGIDLTGGMDEGFFVETGLVSEVFPTAPGWWQFVATPIEVRGLSRAFEAVVSYEVTDGEGAIIEEGNVITGASGPDFGPMVIDLDFSVPTRQLGSLFLFEVSAEDGSRIHLREIPIYLEP